MTTSDRPAALWGESFQSDSDSRRRRMLDKDAVIEDDWSFNPIRILGAAA